MGARMRAVSGLLLLGALGAAQAFSSDLACEQELVLFTSPNGSSTTVDVAESSSLVQLNYLVIVDTKTTVVRRNTTEISLLWDFFSQTVAYNGSTVQVVHTNGSAAEMCGKWWSLGTLAQTLDNVKTSCNYKANVNGSHIATALFRIATECTQNAVNTHCTPPENFLAFATPSSSSATSIKETPNKRVTTTTTTFLSHTFTYGDAPLMQKVCPNSCDVVGTCEALPPPPADCCNAVLFDAAFTHLGVGPRFECPTPKNTTATCDHEPTALKEVSVAAGGRVTLRSGGGVAIPANALAGSGCPDPCPIMVSPATSVAKALAAGQIADSNPAWEDVALVSAIYDLAPSGITFAAPVTVCLSTAGAVDVAAAEIYQIAVSNSAIIGERKTAGVEYKAAENLLCFQTSSFSRYVALTKASSQSPALNVTVLEPGTPYNYDWVILVSVLGGVGLLLLITLVAYQCTRNLHKDPGGDEELSSPSPRHSRSSSRRGSQSPNRGSASPLEQASAGFHTSGGQYPLSSPMPYGGGYPQQQGGAHGSYQPQGGSYQQGGGSYQQGGGQGSYAQQPQGSMYSQGGAPIFPQL